MAKIIRTSAEQAQVYVEDIHRALKALQDAIALGRDHGILTNLALNVRPAGLFGGLADPNPIPNQVLIATTMLVMEPIGTAEGSIFESIPPRQTHN